MNFQTLLFTLFLCLVQFVSAYPITKRFIISPSSPVFSLIAIHKGEEFQANLVKFNGTSIKLNTKDKALFGQIEASNGYVLNLPSLNSTNATNTTIDVLVNSQNQLVSTTRNGSASEHFGINNTFLTFNNSTQFRACPETPLNATTNSSSIEYDLFFDPRNNTRCEFGTGYDVKLLVQVSLPITFNEQTNSADIFSNLKRDAIEQEEGLFKRLYSKIFN
ncbi:unnamed protein product [Candida verbasci]|uniref:Uncharacterized protein n=1 Tax=Candida verbasci TaxID=1227364 RepID=A0A9W4TTY9_9ASCO|nr:unnamed protein product [Candida verbasci]